VRSCSRRQFVGRHHWLLVGRTLLFVMYVMPYDVVCADVARHISLIVDRRVRCAIFAEKATGRASSLRARDRDMFMQERRDCRVQCRAHTADAIRQLVDCGLSVQRVRAGVPYSRGSQHTRAEAAREWAIERVSARDRVRVDASLVQRSDCLQSIRQSSI
jgi:hypothetical protein